MLQRCDYKAFNSIYYKKVVHVITLNDSKDSFHTLYELESDSVRDQEGLLRDQEKLARLAGIINYVDSSLEIVTPLIKS